MGTQNNSLLLFIHLVFHSTASVEGDRGSPRPLPSRLCYAMAFSIYMYFCSNFPFPQTSDILTWGLPSFSMTSSPLYDICNYPTSKKKSHIGGTLWLDFSMSFGENEIPPGTWPLWRSHFIKEGENSLLSKEVDLGLRQIKPLICGVRNNPSNFCLDKQLLCFGFWTYPKNPGAEGLVPSRWYYWESKDHLGGVA